MLAVVLVVGLDFGGIGAGNGLFTTPAAVAQQPAGLPGGPGPAGGGAGAPPGGGPEQKAKAKEIDWRIRAIDDQIAELQELQKQAEKKAAAVANTIDELRAQRERFLKKPEAPKRTELKQAESSLEEAAAQVEVAKAHLEQAQAIYQHHKKALEKLRAAFGMAPILTPEGSLLFWVGAPILTPEGSLLLGVGSPFFKKPDGKEAPVKGDKSPDADALMRAELKLAESALAAAGADAEVAKARARIEEAKANAEHAQAVYQHNKQALEKLREKANGGMPPERRKAEKPKTDLHFEQVVWVRNKAPQIPQMYVLVPEVTTAKELDELQKLVRRYAPAALREVDELAGPDARRRARITDNLVVVFVVPQGKGNKQAFATGFSIDQLKEYTSVPEERALKSIGRHAWTFQKLPLINPGP